MSPKSRGLQPARSCRGGTAPLTVPKAIVKCLSPNSTPTDQTRARQQPVPQEPILECSVIVCVRIQVSRAVLGPVSARSPPNTPDAHPSGGSTLQIKHDRALVPVAQASRLYRPPPMAAGGGRSVRPPWRTVCSEFTIRRVPPPTQRPSPAAHCFACSLWIRSLSTSPPHARGSTMPDDRHQEKATLVGCSGTRKRRRSS